MLNIGLAESGVSMLGYIENADEDVDDDDDEVDDDDDDDDEDEEAEDKDKDLVKNGETQLLTKWA